jgi:hypothetical protein
MLNWLREFVGPQRKPVSYLAPCPAWLNIYQAFGVKFIQSSMVLLNANEKIQEAMGNYKKSSEVLLLITLFVTISLKAKLKLGDSPFKRL